jgi:fatty acid desaturase
VKIEKKTFKLAILIYLGWLTVTLLSFYLPYLISIPLISIILVLHSGIRHETFHGHPTDNEEVNYLIGFLPLNIFTNYGVDKRNHIRHHQVELTSINDPASEYYDSAVISQLSNWQVLLLDFNNTLIGRVFFGGLVSTAKMIKSETDLLINGDLSSLKDIIFHVIGIILVFSWLKFFAGMTLLEYVVLFVYPSSMIIQFKKFTDHQYHKSETKRTNIVESNKFTNFLYLNQNYHAVHHHIPTKPWHELVDVYELKKLDFNWTSGYIYKGFFDVVKNFLLNRKDQIQNHSKNFVKK